MDAANHTPVKPELTAERLREVLSYDPDTGVFTWLKRANNRTASGKPAGCLSSLGYVLIRIDSVLYSAHRLALLHITGEWPKINVDHVNGERSDNRISNLRDCSQSENMQNYKNNASNTTGFCGVSFDKSKKKFEAYITLNKKRAHLGRFETAELVHAAYIEAKSRLHLFNPSPRH